MRNLRDKFKLCTDKLAKATIIILILSIGLSIPVFISEVKDSKPDHSKDGWDVMAPEELNLDSGYLKEADKFIGKTDATSFIIVKDGYIVYEKYYRGQRPKNFSYCGSLSNSLLSALIGIAISDGQIKSVEQKIEDFYPELVNSDFNQEIRDITIENLLTMTSGFGEVSEDFFHKTDWIKSQFNSKLMSHPGETFRYSNSATYLLSGIITRTTGMSALEYAKKKILEPMKLNSIIWYTGPEGYNIGGDFLYLTPSGMAKFAYLFINKGSWKGQQILPESWVRNTLKIHTNFSQEELIRFGDKRIMGFGYNTIVSQLDSQKTAYIMEYEVGNQYASIIPDTNMVVVVSTYHSNFKKSFSYSSMMKVLNEYIMPATDCNSLK